MTRVALIITLLAQTRINQDVQTKGTNLEPNGYYSLARTQPNAKVQVFPGPWLNQTLRFEPLPLPPNSQARCGVTMDGKPRPAYEFARVWTAIGTATKVYVCAPDFRWKVFATLGEF